MESNYSPKSSSPHAGGSSPVVALPGCSGTPNTTISLSNTPTIMHTGPFYCIREQLDEAELTDAKDLMTEYGEQLTLTKFEDKKPKKSLASFLPGIYDGETNIENSTLRSVIEKPPICSKELLPLTSKQLVGFRLHPGAMPEPYRTACATPVRSTINKKKKRKKNKQKDGAAPTETSLIADPADKKPHEKKYKKQERHEHNKERKKAKKEKKRKKKNQTPGPSAMMDSGGGSGSGGLTGVGSPLESSGISGALPGSSGTVGVGMDLLNTTPAVQMQLQQQQQQMSSSNSAASLLQQQQQMLHGGGGPGSTLLGSVMGASDGANYTIRLPPL